MGFLSELLEFVVMPFLLYVLKTLYDDNRKAIKQNPTCWCCYGNCKHCRIRRQKPLGIIG